MKTLLAAALTAACITLAGCANPGAPGSSQIDVAVSSANAAATSASPSLSKIEGKISTAAAKICGWEPAASTAASLAATVSGSVTASTLTSVATGLADAICKLVKSSANNGVGLLDRAPAPTYRGVPLIGRFVR